MLTTDERTRLHARLDKSRGTLLAALEGVTERDFGSDVGGETVVQMLARVAAEERDAVETARGRAVRERQVEKPLPPQVIHALAGARYRTARYVDAPDADLAMAEALVSAAERREGEAAERVRGRPELKPLPVAPQIQVIPSGIPPRQAGG